MELLSLKLKSKNNPNIFLVTTSKGEYMLHSDIIVKYNIAVGDIDENLFLKCVNQSLEIIALDSAVKYLAHSLKTTKQVRDYLKKKGYEKVTINAVIDKLNEYKLIDDENFITSYINSNPNFSKSKLKQKLLSFGLKNDMIEHGISEINEYSACKVQVEKFIKNKSLDHSLYEKLIRRLMYQGYAWETIKSVVNEFDFKEEV